MKPEMIEFTVFGSSTEVKLWRAEEEVTCYLQAPVRRS